MLIAKDIMVPMRDGVHLATGVYRPVRNGEPVPRQVATLLPRISYDKAAIRYVDTIANYFTPRGYGVVQQDLRGRYRSEGTGQYHHTSNPHEGMDGYDTIEWIAAQPWSNGRWRGRSIQTTTSIWMACSLRTLPHPRRQRSGSPLTQRILFPPWVAR